MCENCWIENGSPSISTDKTRALAGLINASVNTFSNAARYGHIVFDDQNLDDDDIDYCITALKEADDVDEQERTYVLNTLKEMRKLSYDERWSAMAIFENWIP